MRQLVVIILVGLFFVAPRLRVRLAPGFPCALLTERDNELQQLGQASRENDAAAALKD